MEAHIVRVDYIYVDISTRCFSLTVTSMNISPLDKSTPVISEVLVECKCITCQHGYRRMIDLAAPTEKTLARTVEVGK